MYKALASASPFLTAEGDETPSKNCLILMSAVSECFLWIASERSTSQKTEPTIDHFVENTAPSKVAPNFTISLQIKAGCYYPLF